MKFSKVLITGLTPIILLSLIVAGGAWFARRSAAKKARLELEQERKVIATIPVREAPFDMLAEATGQLESYELKPINAEVNGEILQIVPNGKRVKKGEIVAVLDVPRMARQLRDLESTYNGALIQMEKRKRELATDIERARITLNLAEKDLAQFHAAKESELAEKTKQSEYDAEQLTLTLSRKEQQEALAQEALIPKADVEMLAADIKSKEFGIERQKKEFELLGAKKEAEALDKQAAVDRAKADYTRAQDAEKAEIANLQATLKIQKEQVDRSRKQLKESIVKSPGDGIIVLDPYWDNNGPHTIRPGDDVWDDFRIATIPDLSKMQIAVQLPQEDARLVKKKQKAKVWVDSIPGITFEGEVTEISQTAQDVQQWGPPTGEKAFRTLVLLKSTKKAPLRPGMSGKAQIIIERIPKALAVPLECVFDKDDKKIVYVKRGLTFKPVEVEFGLQNDDMVVIKKGLKAGDRVALHDISTQDLNNGK